MKLGYLHNSFFDTWNNSMKIKFRVDEQGRKFNIIGEKSVINVNRNRELITTWPLKSGRHGITE
jgi:hypothetical protein